MCHGQTKSKVICNNHGRCARKCAVILVGCVENARSGYVNTCMQWHPNTCIPDRKATRNHAFRVEISSRACATSGSRNSCVSNRKAPRALQFLNEMHDQSNHFLLKHMDSTAISIRNRRTQRLGLTAPQPRPRPSKVAWVRSLNT